MRTPRLRAGGREPLRLEAPRPGLGSERSPVWSGEGAGPPRRGLRAGGGTRVPGTGSLGGGSPLGFPRWQRSPTGHSSRLPRFSPSLPSPDQPQDTGRRKWNCRGPPPFPAVRTFQFLLAPSKENQKRAQSIISGRSFLRVLCGRLCLLRTKARSFESPPAGQRQTYLARAR